MKSLKFITIIYLVLLIFQTSISAYNDCPMSEWYPNMNVPGDFTGGYYKPHRTDSAGGQILPLTASFNVIIVFVQFPDEDSLTNNSYWPIGQAPTSLDSLLATVRNNSGDYWDRYNDQSQILSDYYQEVSRGIFHMTGITRHYIFDQNRSYYGTNVTLMNNEIYTKLKADLSIDWESFDKWKYISPGEYINEGDGNLDMLMMIRRTNNGPAGFAGLDGDNFLIEPNDSIWVRPGFSDIGSGFVIQGNQGNPIQPHSYNKFLGILIHEFGHFLFGPHSSVGIMTSRGGNSIHDLFYSPFEKYKLGYIQPVNVNYSQQSSYYIGDISSRTTNNNVLKVPISSNEFYLIENRLKISKWDVKMLGDTTHLDFFRNTEDFGKGIYIYHHLTNDLSYPGSQDQECADGLWNWVQSGTAIPDWSVFGSIPIIKRTSLAFPVNNDNGLWGNLNNKDGISANTFTGSEYGVGVYFGIGKSNDTVGRTGTDKIFTNEQSLWTSREQFGDRYDAWNIGYNEVFSPYSNPNTQTMNNGNSDIYIWLYSNSGSGPTSSAAFKIYKAGEGGHTDSSILQITPPSKPMNLVVDYHLESENIRRLILTWNHNSEPDMLDTNNKKKYKIWRATSTGISVVPTNYTLHNTVEINSGTAPSYIDTTIYAVGSGWPGIGNTAEYPVRYKIQAVDKYQDTSVRSDFDMGIGLIPNVGCANCTVGPDNFISDTEIPKEFKLYGNYPNPFNPSTNIKFDLPKDVQVSIKIYDIVGREVKTLVNEYKTAGRYSVTFSGSDFASGVYYYSIKAGEFEQVRKMILLK